MPITQRACFVNVNGVSQAVDSPHKSFFLDAILRDGARVERAIRIGDSGVLLILGGCLTTNDKGNPAAAKNL